MKETLIRVARIVVSAGLLFLVLRKAPLSDLWTQIQQADVVWLLAAFGVNSLGNVFGAWRWQLLLRSQSRIISMPYLYGSYLVGLFFNNVLPSSIGGDVFRATGARKKGGGTLTENLTVVLVERMIGLLATLTLGGLAALTGAAKGLDPRITWALYLALFVSAAGLYVALSSSMRALAARFLAHIPIDFVQRTGGKMIAAFELFSRARGTLLANYVLSLGFQFLLIVHFYLIQFAFGNSLPFSTFVVVVPLVFFVMLLPIGINGLGVRETAFVFFLTPAGMSETSALALSLTSYGIAVGQGVLGGAVHLYRESRERAARPKIQEPTDASAEA
ncbi:MAG: membrane protein [Gemmatimonadota bacterium]|nr:MAG: membrane protein [Gemmatimonadota bacterium]